MDPVTLDVVNRDIRFVVRLSGKSFALACFGLAHHDIAAFVEYVYTKS